MSHLNVMVDLNRNPLGTLANENFSVPANYRIPPARIYVINHSRTRSWKRVTTSISYKRGAETALMEDKKFRELYGNEDMVYKAVRDGRDMNRYKDEIKPVVWKLAIPGGRFMPLPPAHEETPEKLILVEVPEGTWDIYLGNYDRMRGFPGIKPREVEKFDATVKGAEETALAQRWRMRRNPVFAYRDDEERTELKNPYGILEFVRVSQRATQEPIDKDYLSALDLFEAV